VRNISTAVRDHYDNDRYMWAIIIRRFYDRGELGNASLVRAVCGEKHRLHRKWRPEVDGQRNRRRSRGDVCRRAEVDGARASRR
jgi:hypothetical protein